MTTAALLAPDSGSGEPPRRQLRRHNSGITPAPLLYKPISQFDAGAYIFLDMNNANDAKAELSRAREPSSTVGFRLDPEALDVLRRRAERLGSSHHELARQYVLETLGGQQERAALQQAVVSLQQGVVSLKEELTELREDFALAVECLLTSAGQANEKEAQEWVQKSFRRK
jgi:hypothetical protein